MASDESAFASQVAAAVAVDEANAHRGEVADALAAAFAAFRREAYVYGWMIGSHRVRKESPYGFGDDGIVALSWLAGMASDVISGACVLLRASHRYSAMALIRNLVEIEYLTWAMKEATDEAERWIRSSRTERKQMWEPRHIRERAAGRFRATDYSLHCEFGGHPTPVSGRHLMPDTNNPNFAPAMIWVELIEHGRSCWNYLVDGTAVVDESGSLTMTASRASDDAELQGKWDRLTEVDQLSDTLRAVSQRVPD